jgi:hypothetical protein
VIIADTRSSMVAAKSAAAVGCALTIDVDLDLLPAQRATIRRGRLGPVKFGAQRLESLISARTSACRYWKG